jgi:hypothetical protein
MESTIATFGYNPAPLIPLLILRTSSVRMDALLSSLPVPAVVGIAMMGSTLSIGSFPV